MNSEVRYEFKRLNTKLMRVPVEYQRAYRDEWANRIAENFDPLKVNPIKVSYRDGVYWIVDGMHTTGALKKRNGGADLDVECKVYYGLTKEEEAMLFAGQYENTHKVGSGYKMRAEYVGGDPDVRGLKFAVEAADLALSFDGSRARNKICCCNHMLKLYKESSGISELVTFLKTLKKTWDGDQESLRKEIIGGMWIFCRVFDGEFDVKKAIEKFSKVNPVEIYRNGKMYKNYSGDKKYAFELANIYNKGQRTKLDVNKLQ